MIFNKNFFEFSVIDNCFLIIGVVIFAIITINCTDKTSNKHQGVSIMPAKTIEKVLEEHNEELMSIPGVIGTAQGLCNKKPCIIIFVIKGTEKSEFDKKIPRVLDGYPVDIKETGNIKALPKTRD
jgi:hypothetical protein